MKKLVYFSLGPIIGALVSFITIPVTTYFLSPSEYGKASMFILVQGILAAYLYFGFDQAYTREYHEAADKFKLLKNAMSVPLMIASILSALFLIFQKDIAQIFFQNTKEIFPIYLLCISMFTLIFERFGLLTIRMKEQAKRYSTFTILIKVFILGGTLSLLVLGKRDYSVIVYGTLLGQIVADGVIIFLTRDIYRCISFNVDKKLVLKLWKFGFPIFIAFSIEAFFTVSDRVIIKIFSDYRELGLYTAAFKIASLLKIVQTSFTSFWVPMAYRWNREEKPIRYFQLVSDFITILFSMIFLALLIGKPLVLLLFNTDYKEVVYIFPFLCFAPLLYTISETTTLGIVFSRKTYLNIIVSIGAIGNNIIVASCLVPLQGAKGAALSMGASYFIYYILRTLLSNREWEGIKLKKQLITISILFIAGLYNTYMTYYSWIFNIACGVIIFTMYIDTMKKLRALRKGGHL